MHLVQPYFVYNHNESTWAPGVPFTEWYTETLQAERYDQVAADGTRYSYFVGDRDIFDFRLQWLDDTDVDNFRPFWESVKDGSTFSIVLDDSVRKCGTGTCGDGYFCGDDSDGDAITTVSMVLDSTEMTIQPGEVHGTWSIEFVARKVTA
jgi:hypothetical protein